MLLYRIIRRQPGPRAGRSPCSDAHPDANDYINANQHRYTHPIANRLPLTLPRAQHTHSDRYPYEDTYYHLDPHYLTLTDGDPYTFHPADVQPIAYEPSAHLYVDVNTYPDPHRDANRDCYRHRYPHGLPHLPRYPDGDDPAG